MLISFLVYLYFIIEKISGPLPVLTIFILISWCVWYFIYYAAGVNLFKDSLNSRDDFIKLYKTKYNETPLKSEFEFCMNTMLFKKILFNPIFKVIVTLCIITSVFMPTQKQLIIIASAPYVVDYFVDVKKDFNDNNTTKTLVEIPRKFIESFSTINEYVDSYFKSKKDEEKNNNDKKSDKSTKSDSVDDKIIEQITQQVLNNLNKGK